ncbi:MAG: hypothetical protein C7B46_06845 [Sulfobacillus benefaciens]|uniref:HTH tetR-type domain-containing protein n=1 Tax=Sulfobacillus benefaciens TaxID=453960 RepID=A0A2T2XI09_9FIRM|nr:MAG: hypothetical protein C7B46_06845 [Sulfobacillus benefaciens]
MEDLSKNLSETAILEVGARLLAQHGYHRVTLEMLANQFGVTRQAIYYYYRSKEQLLEAIYESAMIGLLHDWDVILTEDKLPLVKFTEALRAFIRRVLGQPTAVLVLNTLERELDEPFYQMQRKRWHEYLLKLRILYNAACDQGQVLPIDPHIAVYSLIGAVLSLPQWYRPSGNLTPEDIEHQIMGLLERGYVRFA